MGPASLLIIRTLASIKAVTGRATLVRLLAALALSVGVPAAAASSVRVAEPLIGTNYTHTAFPDCSWSGTAILATYHNRDVRRRVRLQLRAMRALGVMTLRTIVWHMTDPVNALGPISSAGDSISEPYRHNLSQFAFDVRAAGYRRLTVAFGPSWTNNPLAANYDARKFIENWRFVQEVRRLMKP